MSTLSMDDIVESVRTGRHYIVHGLFRKADGTVAFYKVHHISDRWYEYTFPPAALRLLTKRERDVLLKKMRAGNYESQMQVQPRPRRKARISAA